MIEPHKTILFIVNGLLGGMLWLSLLFAYDLYANQLALNEWIAYLSVIASISFLVFACFFVFFHYTEKRRKQIAHLFFGMMWWACLGKLITSLSLGEFSIVAFFLVIIGSFVQVGCMNDLNFYRSSGLYLLSCIVLGIGGYLGGALLVVQWLGGLQAQLVLSMLLSLGFTGAAQILVHFD